MTERAYNFSAGPAVLPVPVLERARDALVDLDSSGIGVLEHSHRGAEISGVFARAEQTCRDLAGVPDDYSVLFLQGGASSQFFMVPMNLLGDGQTADYVNTGTWSKKAIKEAARFGDVHVAASSEDENFTYIPNSDSTTWSDKPVYAHFTSNNTIAGTEFTNEPTPPAGTPLVCDASSDIFSRPIDIAKYGIVYAGAQKNLGPAGVTLVIARTELAEKASETIPTMLQYRTQIASGSCFNTPPVFGVYVLGEVLAWLKQFGGLGAIAEYNREKAALLYSYLDESTFFAAAAQPGSRSLMNVTFRSPSAELDAKFIAESPRHRLKGLKGHRSVGGMRASIYNAFPRQGCVALVEFMKAFELENR